MSRSAEDRPRSSWLRGRWKRGDGVAAVVVRIRRCNVMTACQLEDAEPGMEGEWNSGPWPSFSFISPRPWRRCRAVAARVASRGRAPTPAEAVRKQCDATTPYRVFVLPPAIGRQLIASKGSAIARQRGRRCRRAPRGQSRSILALSHVG